MYKNGLKKAVCLLSAMIFTSQTAFGAAVNYDTIKDLMGKTQSKDSYYDNYQQEIQEDSQDTAGKIVYPNGVLREIYNNGLVGCTEGSGWGYTLDYSDDAPVSDKALRLTMPKDGYQACYLNFDSAFNFNDQMMKTGAIELNIKTNRKFSSLYVTLISTMNGQLMVNNCSVSASVGLAEIAKGWQKVILPLSGWSLEATCWNEKYQENQYMPFDFSNVIGIGVSYSVPQMKEGEVGIVEIDDWCITNGNVEDDMLGVTLLSEEEYAKVNQKFNTLDLRSLMNMGYKDEVANDEKGGWTDQGPSNDFASFDLMGEHKIKGIPFDFVDPDTNNGKSALVLRGQNRAWLPNRVEIPVDDYCNGAYIVHAAAWDSTTAAVYKFVYEDMTEGAIRVRFNKHIANWWGASDKELMRTAWQGSNPSCGTISSYLFAFGNPYPDKKVTKIVLETPGDASIVCIQGITLTNDGPYLPELEDNGNPDTSDWFAYEIPKYDKIKGTILDASYVLDAPAGKHGHLRAEGDKLVFEDGEEIEFWGTNIVGPANFLEKSDTDTLVAAIKASGFNVVRFHHLDSDYYAPNVFGQDHASMELDPNQMDKFCYLWARLKEEGIYFMPGLLCQRPVRSEHGIEDANNVKPGYKFEGMFNRRLIEIQKKYARDLFTYVNPYTGTSLATEPAAVMLEIHNECNITGYGSQYRFQSEHYRQEFYGLFNDWLKEKYGSNQALLAAWNETGKIALKDGESLGSVTLPEEYKTSNFSDQRVKDSFAFLVHIAESYHTEMITFLKEELGVNTPITGVNNIIMDDLADIWENARYDHVDRHMYWTHPNGYSISSGSAAGGLNSQIKTPSSSIFGFMSGQKVLGKPLMISEWNIGELNPYMAEMSVLGAAMYGYQGWSSTMFDYLSGPIPYANKITGFFDSMNEPLRHGFHPASAVIRDSVGEAQTGYFTDYTDEQVFDPINQMVRVPANVVLTGKSGINFVDLLDYEYDNDESLLEKSKEPVTVSDTKEIIFDPENTIFRLNAPKAHAISGNPKGARIDLDYARFVIDNEIATVTLTAMDDKQIPESDKLLLTVGARVRNTGMKMSPDGKTVVVGGSEPIILEPVTGQVTIKTADDYAVYVVDSSGKRTKTLETETDENGYTVINLTKKDKTMHYEIVRTKDNEETARDGFKDVYQDTDGAEAIKAVCDAGIMVPVSDTLFMPDTRITKGDFIGALVRKLGLSGTDAEQFADVGEYNKNYKEFIAARSAGIAFGDGVNTKPYEYITYGTMKAFLERANVNADLSDVDMNAQVTRGAVAKILNSF